MFVLTLLFGVLMIAFGIFSICRPDTIWELRESWKHNHRYTDEPSELYRKLTMASGFVISAAGLFLAILSMILLIQ